MSPFAGYDIAIAVVGIMIGIAGILLGVGYAMNNRQLKELATAELFQSFVNAAIIGVLFIAFSNYGVVTLAMNGIVGVSTSGTVCDADVNVSLSMCFASAYLTGVLAPLYFNGHSMLSLTEGSLLILTPLSAFNALLAAIGPSGSPEAALLQPLTIQLGYAVKMLSLSLVGIQVQGALLKVISAVAAPVVLPIGLILRTFYPTRQLGGTIIAVAIGFFAVFPLTYIMNAQISSTTWQNSIQSTMNSTTQSAQRLQSTIGGTLGSNSIPGQVLTTVSGFVGGTLGPIQDILTAVSLVVIEVFFFPIFSLILTVISIREMARVLGSEMSFAHFGIRF